MDGRKRPLGSIPQRKAEMTSQGIRPVQKMLQDAEIDADLRSRLWSQVYQHYIRQTNDWRSDFATPAAESFYRANPQMYSKHQNELQWGIHGEYLKTPPMHDWGADSIYEELEILFLHGPWEEVYLVMQLLVKYYPLESLNESFMTQCNKVLDEENSAYQFIAGRILPKMSDLEIKEVEEAASGSDEPSKLLDKAVEKLAQGDTKNAIKEAVLAVESLTNLLSPKPDSTDLKKTLPKVLGRIEKALGEKYNPSLKDTFIKMYDYASSEPGVRHGSKDRPSYAEEAEARFVVVACSALITYLRTKASDAEIDWE